MKFFSEHTNRIDIFYELSRLVQKGRIESMVILLYKKYKNLV